MDFETHVENLNTLFVDLFPSVSTGDWTQLPLSEQKALRDLLYRANRVVGKLRSEFDSTVYAGHRNGTVDESVAPIRAPRSGDAPERKAPNAQEALDKLLS